MTRGEIERRAIVTVISYKETREPVILWRRLEVVMNDGALRLTVCGANRRRSSAVVSGRFRARTSIIDRTASLAAFEADVEGSDVDDD